MDKLNNRKIVDQLTELAKKNQYVFLESAAYPLNTTPTYLLQFARMAAAISEGELILTFEKGEYDGHKRYVLLTKAKYAEVVGKGIALGRNIPGD